MKVGVFMGNFAPTAGGGFTFADDILQALIKLGSRHTFIVFSYLTENQTSGITNQNVQFYCLKTPVQLGLLKQARKKLIMIIAKATTKMPKIQAFFHLNQILHKNWLQKAIDDMGIEFMWFPTPFFIEVNIPYIYTVWDLQHRLQPWFPEVSANGQWRGREQMYATAIPRAFTVIVGAEAGKAETVHFYRVPPERVKLIPHPTPGFALRASKNSSKEVLTKYHIPEGYLFYPAQFWPHKNHVGLLLAVSLLRERYDLNLPVVFVGSDQGNLQYVRRMMDELNLSGHVYFLGFVPQEDLVGLYRHAFALTYSTFFGPENLPPLEAFALGCPVIASNVSGAQEQLGDAALLVDPRDEEQIALAIKSLYENPSLRRTLVKRGLKRAASWTSEDFVTSVFAILDEFEPFRRCWTNTEPYIKAK